MFSLAEILTATGGRLLFEKGDRATSVSTDSRAIEAGSVFFALRGERFDGHDHIDAAIGRGASVVVVEKEAGAPKGSASVVLVSDTTRALGALGRAHRRRWAHTRSGEPRLVIAITGSAGKTTTRAAIASAMRALGRNVHASSGNLNNQIGVPVTLFGLEAAHDMAVVEIGTNQRGEIAYGAGIAEPDVGVLTLVSEAHAEGLGTVWDIAKEKGDLLLALPRSGAAIVNADDARASAELLRSPALHWIRYGTREGVDVRLVSRTPRGLRGSDVAIAYSDAQGNEARLEAEVPLLGSAGGYAALAVVSAALATVSGVTPERLARALVSLGDMEPGRLSPIELADGTIVIDDAYNANPVSMKASIAAASEIAKALDRRLVLVLGEMRELGPHAAQLHREVAPAIAASGAACVIAVSGHAKELVTSLPQGVASAIAEDAARAATALEAKAKPKDVILVKGSNSIGLSKVASAFAKR